jgi:hypothetical protein
MSGNESIYSKGGSGKGSSPRPVAGQVYRENFDAIFRKNDLLDAARKNIIQMGSLPRDIIPSTTRVYIGPRLIKGRKSRWTKRSYQQLVEPGHPFYEKAQIVGGYSEWSGAAIYPWPTLTSDTQDPMGKPIVDCTYEVIPTETP